MGVFRRLDDSAPFGHKHWRRNRYIFAGQGALKQGSEIELVTDPCRPILLDLPAVQPAAVCVRARLEASSDHQEPFLFFLSFSFSFSFSVSVSARSTRGLPP